MSGISFEGRLWDKGNVTQAMRKAANDARVYGLQIVRSRTPVDTGKMKASWDAQLTNRGILWTNSAPYSQFVELGTRKMAPRYPLTNSLPAIENRYLESLGKQLGYQAANKALERLSKVSRDPAYGSSINSQARPYKGFAR